MSSETSRAEAAPAPECTWEASNLCWASTGLSSRCFSDAPTPWLKDSISSSMASSSLSSSDGA